MRFLLYGLLLLHLIGKVSAQAPTTPTRPLYTALITDVSPAIRAGRTFVPIRAISQQFGATIAWMPETRMVRITRENQPTIQLTINSRTAQVNGNTITLDAAPFIELGRTMVPLRFISETYNVPVEYHTPTRSVRLYREDRIYVLPLEDPRSGVFIYDPRPNELVRNPILVQGQANVYEGNLIIEVRDSGGHVLGRTITTAGMGGFYPYSTRVYYNLPSEDPSNGRIVVFSENGRGNGQILAQDAVDVRLASTI